MPRVRRCIVALLLLAGALLVLAPSAQADIELQSNAELTSIEQAAVPRLEGLMGVHYDSHQFPIEIGYREPEGPHIADTFAKFQPTNLQLAQHILPCGVTINRTPFLVATSGGDYAQETAVITHEVFHCFEFQFDYQATNNFNHLRSWVSEGLARWVDMTLASDDPTQTSIGDLQYYYAHPGIQLFARSTDAAGGYDAVGFWGHVQDTTHNLWHQIPNIVAADATHGDTAALNTALGGFTDPTAFYESWGSSLANNTADGPDWTSSSPLGSNGSEYKSTPIDVGDGVPANYVAQLKPLPSFAAGLYDLHMPTAPANAIETMHIDLGPAYGRFGADSDANFTTERLNRLTFCASVGSCPTLPTPQPTPPGDCSAGSVPAPPPPPTKLTPLPAEPLLGVASDLVPAGPAVIYRVISTAPATGGSGDCIPTDAGGPDAGAVGDPHLISWGGIVYDDQTRGEYTFVKSSVGGLDVQARMQSVSDAATAITAIAAKVGGDAVEVVPGASSSRPPIVYLNGARDTKKATGVDGGAVEFTADPAAGLTDTLASEINAGESGKDVVIVWPDGARLVVEPEGPVSFQNTRTVLAVAFKGVSAQRGHLSGLLGNTGVPSADAYVGGNGHRYSASQITSVAPLSSPTRAALKTIIAFNRSWQLTQTESLFTYPAGRTTRSYDLGYAPDAVNGATVSAVKACAKVAVKYRRACEYDVTVTNNQNFGIEDQEAVALLAAKPAVFAHKPVWTLLSTTHDDDFGVQPAVESVGPTAAVAFRDANATGVVVDSFTPTEGVTLKPRRVTAVSGWAGLANPLWLTWGSTDDLFLSGARAGTSGIASLSRASTGALSSATAFAAGVTLGQGALLSSGGTPILSSDLLGDGSFGTLSGTPSPTSYDLGGGADNVQLGRDAGANLWAAWADGSGIQVQALNPVTGAPAANSQPATVPGSTNEQFSLACDASCHVIYPSTSTTQLDAWSPGQSGPTVIASVPSGQTITNPLAVAAGSQLWVAYGDSYQFGTSYLDIKLGGADGAGGSVTSMLTPSQGRPQLGAAAVTPAGLVVAWNWVDGTDQSTSVWSTVIPNP